MNHLFQDLYLPFSDPEEQNHWIENGEKLNSLFKAILPFIKHGQSVSSILDRANNLLSSTEQFIINLYLEDRPHSVERKQGIIPQNCICTLDIAFRRNLYWIDGSLAVPSGKVDQQRTVFLNSIYQKHEKLLESLNKEISFSQWTSENQRFLSSIVEGIGGHGIGNYLHQSPDFIYSEKKSINYEFYKPFTLEPVYWLEQNGEKIFAYNESSVLMLPDCNYSFPDMNIGRSFCHYKK